MTERPGPEQHHPMKDDRQRQADLDWLYGGSGRTTQPGVHEQSRAHEGLSSQPPSQQLPARPPVPQQPVAGRHGSYPPYPPDGGQPNGPEASPAPLPRLPRRRRRRRVFRLLRLVAILLLAWLAWLIGVPLHAAATMKTVSQAQPANRPAQEPGTAILLVGTDDRSQLTPQQQAQLGTGNDAGSRSDTIMILYRPPKGRSVLVSLPRDSYVPIPGHGSNKLNAAYSYGGPALLIQTVETVTGVRIDGYLEIGFGGFAGLVDAVGGVGVCLSQPMQDTYANINLPAGCQTLNGPNALGYVRQRYQDPQGDIGRAQRQREIIGKVVAKAVTPATILNPVRYWKLNQAASQMLTRGDQTGNGILFAAARALLDVSGGKNKGLSLVVPIANPAGWSPDGQSVVIWDRQQALALFDEISKGDTSQLDRFAG